MNARRSTGPKSPAGKKRSAKNATSHGLSVPIDIMPSLKAQRDRIAKYLIASAGFTSHKATECAAALLLIQRTRRERFRLFSEAEEGRFPVKAPSTLRYERDARAIFFRAIRGI
jgi:hypothetical protein